MNIENIAKVCHEANKAYCEGIGDNSQVAWGNAPDWQKESAVSGVRFNLENPHAPASSSHDNWLEEKANDGWKYGEAKDVEKKEHPCCVAYQDLPVEQQVKDSLFKSIVSSLSLVCDEACDSVG